MLKIRSDSFKWAKKFVEKCSSKRWIWLSNMVIFSFVRNFDRLYPGHIFINQAENWNTHCLLALQVTLKIWNLEDLDKTLFLWIKSCFFLHFWSTLKTKGGKCAAFMRKLIICIYCTDLRQFTWEVSLQLGKQFFRNLSRKIENNHLS